MHRVPVGSTAMSHTRRSAYGSRLSRDGVPGTVHWARTTGGNGTTGSIFAGCLGSTLGSGGGCGGFGASFGGGRSFNTTAVGAGKAVSFAGASRTSSPSSAKYAAPHADSSARTNNTVADRLEGTRRSWDDPGARVEA